MGILNHGCKCAACQRKRRIAELKVEETKKRLEFLAQQMDRSMANWRPAIPSSPEQLEVRKAKSQFKDWKDSPE